ncbi:MAG TPA: HAD hydrolase-like protein [Candidatus Krumholzibacteria bacterium]|nr:HAD hydrolase-like protein [Candidatus Krumholzibacteria bacterium]
MTDPRPCRAFLVDIEGVLVRDKRYLPIAGAVAWLENLEARGLPWCLVSNNTSHAPEDLVSDLRHAGFPVTLERLVGVLGLGAQWLRQRGRRRIHWLGRPALADWWRGQGFALVGPDDCETVVLGVNAHLTVEALDAVLPALHDRQVELLCLHRNGFWLDDRSGRRLGPGAWAAALAAAAPATRVVTVGKPAEPIYHEALKRVAAAPADTLFISDDPVADLVTAARLGMRTAFVLSGKFADCSVLGTLDQEQWPHIIGGSLADIDPDGTGADAPMKG